VVACACLGGCAADEGASGGDGERAAGIAVKRDAARTVVREDAAPDAVLRKTAARILVTRDDPGLPGGCRPRPLAGASPPSSTPSTAATRPPRDSSTPAAAGTRSRMDAAADTS
jgi:hypothetical protein